MRKTFVCVIGTTLLLAGCAQAPTEQLTATEQAIQQARTMEAETYAANHYQEAFDAINAARAEITAQDEAWFFSRDYGKAVELLTQAEQAADTAETTAQTNKEQARMEAEAALAQAESALAAAEQALQNAPAGKGTRAEIEALRADLAAAVTSLTEARQSFESSHYFEANTRLSAVIAKAQSISSEVEQAVAKTRRTRS